MIKEKKNNHNFHNRWVIHVLVTLLDFQSLGAKWKSALQVRVPGEMAVQAENFSLVEMSACSRSVTILLLKKGEKIKMKISNN